MTKNNGNKSTPAYVALCGAIGAALEEAGVALKAQANEIDGVQGNMGWACFERQDNGHKVYVRRAADLKGCIVHTTVELDPATPGFVDHMGKAEGKIAAWFQPDEELVLRHLVPAFVDVSEPLRANRNRRPSSEQASA